MTETGEILVKVSRIHGLGVFAARHFKEGDRILEIDDSRVVTKENPLVKDKGEYETYCDYLAMGKVVLMRWPERHINHSCDPNSYVRAIGPVRYVYARRDCLAGKEITYDYCIDGGGDTVWQCNCDSYRCRKTIHLDFFHLPLDLQIEYLPLLSDWYIEQNQKKVDALGHRSDLWVPEPQGDAHDFW